MLTSALFLTIPRYLAVDRVSGKKTFVVGSHVHVYVRAFKLLNIRDKYEFSPFSSSSHPLTLSTAKNMIFKFA